jgi:tetratricopeptide (TPR) repeat protein
MKISSKIAVAALSLVCVGSAVSAQSLDDAKKAIDAEQYQKAKSMLKNLTVTEANKDENYFYLGWVYLKEDEPDSAKMWFNKGIAVNPKSSLNYVGLGAAAHLDKDNANAVTNFNQAIAFAPKKDTKPYVYIGQGYLLTVNGAAPSTADAQASLAVLQKGEAINKNDPELELALGNAYTATGDASNAYTSYSNAQTLAPKWPAPLVTQGATLKNANNFEDAIGDFQKAIALDPNYGPAYREWAETDARWARNDPKVMVDKDNEAITEYQKYLSLTDRSLQSQMRYADFLITAGKYQELETVAKAISSSANSNLRAYRYIAYAAYQNKDYQAGLTAMNTWMSKADPKRIIAQDYLYLGRLQMASGQDSIGMNSLRKAYDLDSTQADVLDTIARALFAAKKYKQAGDAYYLYISKAPNNYTLVDLFNEGRGYYFGFDPKKPDTASLVRADSAFSKVQQKATRPVADAALMRARVKDLEEPDHNNIKGLALPFYQNYIDLTVAKGTPTDTRTKNNLVEAYDYVGRYNEYIAKDDAKAADAYNKALAINPTDEAALDYQKRKGKK